MQDMKAARELTFEARMDQWEDFIKEIEAGYSFTIYDYENDLSVRDILQRAIQDGRELSNSERQRLKELDTRFYALTRSRDYLTFEPERPWGWRVPKEPKGELADDLAEEYLEVERKGLVPRHGTGPTPFTEVDVSDWRAHVWVFNGSRQSISSAVFTAKPTADEWIAANRLTGTLIAYPIDTPVYDFAREIGGFKPTELTEQTPQFVGNFCGGLPRFMYVLGCESNGFLGNGLPV